MSTTTPNIGLFKYDTTSDGSLAFSITRGLNNNWDKIDEAISNSGGGTSRNIGEIVASTIPLTDAGLHLLDGSLIQGSGIYKKFVAYIADLYAENPTANYFTDETSWQSSVSTYGACGKFVYDSTLNTVRLPKVSDILQGTTDANVLGDLVKAGLPYSWLNHTHTRGSMNITGYFKINKDEIVNASGAFIQGTSPCGNGAGAAYAMPGDVNFDASRSWTGSTSSPNYTDNSHNSSTVQPQTIKVLTYIVIATATKTDIQVDIDTITTDLNGKVNISDLVEVQCVVETYQNGASWYRVWSDGWCEQGGYISSTASGTAYSLLKTMKDTGYIINITAVISSWSGGLNSVYDLTTSSFKVWTSDDSSFNACPLKWEVKGYIEV